MDPAKKAVMLEVVQQHLNAIPAAKSSDPRAFIEAVVNWCGKWWRHKPRWKSVASGCCGFVFDPTFAATGLPHGYAEKLLFRDMPSPNIGGHMYVSDIALTIVYADSVVLTDPDSLVRRIKAVGRGTAPAVLFDPEAGLLVIALEGVSGATLPFQLAEFDGQLTVGNVDALLDSFYDSTLKHTDSVPHLWYEPANFIPIFDAEKLYQALTFIYLRGNTQGTWVVVREEHSNSGLPDLTLRTTNPAITFVMEMKVLRSFGFEREGEPSRPKSDEDNRLAADDGVSQAMGYRKACSAQEAFLLIYDMRQVRGRIATVDDRCLAESIHVRYYEILNATARTVRLGVRGKRTKRKRSKKKPKVTP